MSIFLPILNNGLFIKALSPDDVVGNDSLKNNVKMWGHALNASYILLGLIIATCFVVIVYAGYTYTTSEGELQKVEQAKKSIIGAGIGLGIALFSLTIVNMFAEFIGG